MNKKELLNKKMEILKQALENVNNSPEVFAEAELNNPEIVDKKLSQQKESTQNGGEKKSL